MQRPAREQAAVMSQPRDCGLGVSRCPKAGVAVGPRIASILPFWEVDITPSIYLLEDSSINLPVIPDLSTIVSH